MTGAVSGGAEGAASAGLTAGTFKVWPICNLRSFVFLFSLRRSESETLYCLAMPVSVSPFATTWGTVGCGVALGTSGGGPAATGTALGTTTAGVMAEGVETVGWATAAGDG